MEDTGNLVIGGANGGNVRSQNFKGKYYISSLCPVVVSNIEKFHPELIDNLAPIVSPMIAAMRRIPKSVLRPPSNIISLPVSRRES